MLRTFSRLFLPNPFDAKLRRCARRGGKKILLGWNRGLGDIALGLFAMVKRIRDWIPDAEISFLTRENLRDGFSLLEGVTPLIAPSWKRGEPADVKTSLKEIGRDPKEYDLIIERPSPTDWVQWQRGHLVPRLKWNPAHDTLWENFDLPDGFTYIGAQVVAETQYAFWRNWPLEQWRRLFERLEKMPRVKILLFGFGEEPRFSHPHLIDLRGKTSLFELLSIVKNRCHHLILPDSGILSTVYYLDTPFSIQILSLWADPNHGILKQGVASPNPKLLHRPLIGAHRNLATIPSEEVLNHLFPPRPIQRVAKWSPLEKGSLEGAGAILLAGGQGSRFGFRGPKGAFPLAGKSLFQWIAEKLPTKNFPLAIMTSPLNHEETVRFFTKRQNFGREIFFFQQELLPFLDQKLYPLKSQGPDGNGAFFKAFVKSGLFDLFEKRGIDVITIVPIENPLADPADRALIAHHRQSKATVTVKCIERERKEEQMGALVEREGRIEVIEYLYLDPALFYPYSYAGMVAMDLSFVRKMAQIELPCHWVKKKIPLRNLHGWKREQFLFDAFPYAENVSALCYPRNLCYAPLKCPKNLKSVETILLK